MKKLLLIALLSLCQMVFSQTKGTVKGLVTDKEMNNEPLPFANVFVKGTTIGGTTEMDGTFSFQVPSGNQTIVFSFVGYETVEQPINVIAGKTVTVDQLMRSAGQMIEEVEIKATVNKATESAVLMEQKKATVIKESIGAVELSKKGVSDAAAATTKVSGVAKQEGSSKVYVRGLGDRYNSTTLNGLPLPSNNPSNKNIALDLFSTDMIQSVGVSKSFDASLSGDVSGANIDVKSKEFTGRPYLSLGIGFGGNSQTTAQRFNTIDGANWFGVADHTKHEVTDLTKLPFTDNFVPNTDRVAPLTTSVSLSGGRRFEIGEESSFSMFLVGGFSNNYLKRDGFSINILNKVTDANGNVTDFTRGSSYSDAKEYKYSNNKLAMGNFVYKIDSKNKLSLNSLFVHSNNQNIQHYIGQVPDVADNSNELATNILQTQNQNKLIVNQLLSEHKIGEKIDLNLGVSYNMVNNDEPNRKKNLFRTNTDTGVTQFATATARYNSRYYHNLKEGDINAMFTLTKYFGNRDENKGNVKFGYSFRNTDRDFEAIYFDYELQQSTITDINNSDAVLSQQGLNKALIKIKTGNGTGSKALNPFTYNAAKTYHAPFAMINYNITDNFFVSAGVRYEKIDMEVEWNTNLSKSSAPQQLNNNYILPSLNLKYNLTEDNLLRLSASKTYTYPQFKEVANFVYEGVNYQEFGNPNLKPSENYNIDLKWEMFPNRGELISATVFGKVINDAINRIEQNAASDNLFSYLNTGDSKVYGVEVELKKNLVTLNEDNNEKIKVGFNATYMYNKQKFNKTTAFRPTNDEDPLEGAAPFLLNVDVTYARKVGDKSTNVSLVFNYQDEKLYSIGTVNGLEGIYQKALPRLDFIFKQSFSDRLGAKLSVKNILNPKIERYRDLPTSPITRSYKNGINFSLGFNYKL